MELDVSSDVHTATYTLQDHENRIRLDVFLKQQYPRRSREQIKAAIHEGKVTVKRQNLSYTLSSKKLKASTLLMAQDKVKVISERKVEPDVCFDYSILYEDEFLLALDKPAPLPVHPAGKYFFNTLWMDLKIKKIETYLVHRLDSETSGVLILAKKKTACASLTQQFAERNTEKRYLAIIHGICPEHFHVDLPLKRDPHSRIHLKMTTAPKQSPGAKEALTLFHRIKIFGPYSLVEAIPKTGRQHQIRVHLKSANLPIVGDKLYSLSEEEKNWKNHPSLILPRHALHATFLAFIHPVTGQKIELHSPLPKDLSSLIK